MRVFLCAVSHKPLDPRRISKASDRIVGVEMPMRWSLRDWRAQRTRMLRDAGTAEPSDSPSERYGLQDGGLDARPLRLAGRDDVGMVAAGCRDGVALRRRRGPTVLRVGRREYSGCDKYLHRAERQLHKGEPSQ